MGFGLGLGRRLMLDALLERDEDGEKEAPLVRVPLELVEHLQRGKRRRSACGRSTLSVAVVSVAVVSVVIESVAVVSMGMAIVSVAIECCHSKRTLAK